MKSSRVTGSVLLLFVACSGTTKTNWQPVEQPAVKLQQKVLTRGLTYPWEIYWGPDNFIWMTERDGAVSRVHPVSGAKETIFKIPDVQSRGEGGLLGMALHPNFLKTPYVYVVYCYEANNGYNEKVVRFTYNGKTHTAPRTLLDGIAASGIHNGSRLLIAQDKLFITTGDAANQSSAQRITALNGKVLRLNLDGSIPKDNPIPNSPVWSWGHRNAQGLVLAGDNLFSSEHGPESNDEINIIEKGKNYGWPNVKGLCNDADEQTFCNTHAVKEPVKTWTPTAAVSGLEYYNNDAIPQWKNSLLIASLKHSRIYQLKLNAAHTQVTGTTAFFRNDYGRLRDLCVAPNGTVYVCTSNGEDDKIVMVRSQ